MERLPESSTDTGELTAASASGSRPGLRRWGLRRWGLRRWGLRPGRGLKRRVVVALALVILAVHAVVLYFDDRGFQREQLASLQNRAQLFADLYAGTVAQAFWEYSDEVTARQLRTLIGAVPEFRYATVTTPDGSLFASAGEIATENAIGAKADIRHDGKTIGRIDIYLTSNLAELARIDHLRRQILISLSLSILLLIAILAALHFVTRPLTQLTALMGQFARGELEPAVPHIERADEVGDMARALEVFRDHAVDLQNKEAFLQRQASELSALNQKLRIARDQAERASRIKSEFLSNMSHELRTPMNAILGFAQLIELDGEHLLRSKHREYLGLILSAGRHLLSLIDDVLDVARIESGKVNIRLAPIDVESLLLEFARAMRPIAEKSHIRFDAYSQLPPDLMMRADRVRLLQALNNLGTNAIKYNAAGGLVQLRALHIRQSKKLRLEVRDSGIGIPLARQAELFKPFNRLGQERSAIEGTGIGLALTRQLVDLMGGTIGCQSEQGAGSTFWIELPLDEPEATSGGVHKSHSPVAAMRAILTASGNDLSAEHSVLYIAKDMDDLALMEEIVNTLPSVRFLSAPTGRAGLLFARCNRPRLVLIDLVLQDMAGEEVLRQLRQDPDLSGTTFVAIAGDPVSADDEAIRAAGFDHCICKPIEMSSFLKLLRQTLALPDATIPYAS
ncbi:MAG TPA: ATP-binding protein [Dongiaceae bacterium]|nr:ATP-binding protein [Dongiaceae bacterium]